MNFKGDAGSLKRLIDASIAEDGCSRDITTNNLIASSQEAEAIIKAKENAVVCGAFLARIILKRFDSKINVKILVCDGKKVKKGKPVLRIRGKAQAILKSERIILNFLSHLSGIATKTSEAVSLAKGSKAVILDTRKTTPGLRDLEKYAVRCGGAHNHRMNLSEMAMIKDNHWVFIPKAMSLKEAVRKIKVSSGKRVEVEVDTLKQLPAAIEAKADVILLDNMNTRELRRAVSMLKKISGKKPLLEASGGVTLNNLKQIAKTGVDRISLGALTHSVDAIDMSMEFV